MNFKVLNYIKFEFNIGRFTFTNREPRVLTWSNNPDVALKLG